jgi:hypothetical protein
MRVPIRVLVPASAGLALLCTALFGAQHFRSNITASTVARLPDGTPTLGNYPDTSIPLSTNANVTPNAPPTNATRITVATSTNFRGNLEGDPTTGVVRVTDANPAGAYTVTVTAFNGGGATATRMFTLTVTTPTTCAEVNFAAPANFNTGHLPTFVAVGDFNGDVAIFFDLLKLRRSGGRIVPFESRRKPGSGSLLHLAA